MTLTRSHKRFFEQVRDLQVFRSIVVLNGRVPDPSFFAESELPVIAVDGATNSLLRQGIRPELVVGDLDSVDLATRRDLSVVHLPDQSQSDFEKALAHLTKLHLMPAIVVGIGGGYIDHVINNVNIFLNSGCIFYDPPIMGYVLRQNSIHSFSLPVQSKVSLMGIPFAVVSTCGLKWNLERTKLHFPGQNSCFNRTATEQFSIEVHEGSQ